MLSILRQSKFKKIVKHIEKKIGTNETGSLVAILADSLDNLTNDGNNHHIRTVEIKYNDFYSLKFDFEKGEYVK